MRYQIILPALSDKAEYQSIFVEADSIEVESDISPLKFYKQSDNLPRLICAVNDWILVCESPAVEQKETSHSS